jgi:hypothetical protein
MRRGYLRKGVLSVGFMFAVLILLSFSTRNVSALDGTSISVGVSDGFMSGTDHQATFLVTVVNNEASGSHHVFLTLEVPVLPSGDQWNTLPVAYPLEPGWTYSFSPSEFDVGHGQSKQSTLTITGTGGTIPGLKPVEVIGYWIDHLTEDTSGMHNVYAWATPPFNSYVTVLVKLMVPEYLLGTILGLVGMFAAFGAYYFQKRKQFSP